METILILMKIGSVKEQIMSLNPFYIMETILIPDGFGDIILPGFTFES